MSATELIGAADFLEANGWLPTALGTPAVEAVAAPLLPGDKGRIVAALREAARQAEPMSAPQPTEADRERAAELAPCSVDCSRDPEWHDEFHCDCGAWERQQAIATALAAAREEGRDSVGLADFMPATTTEEGR